MRRRRAKAFCCYCRRPLAGRSSSLGTAFTRDHVFPVASGIKGRWVPACRTCNFLKGDLTPSQWFWFIDHHPRWWRGFTTPQQVSEAVAQRYRLGSILPDQAAAIAQQETPR